MASGSSLRPTAVAVAASRPSTPLPPLLPLDVTVLHSADVWQYDLATLFSQAKDRFGDVSWQVGQTRNADGGGSSTSSDDDESLAPKPPRSAAQQSDQRRELPDELAKTIWGHKAIVYARAPPAFLARYFPPSQLRSSSPIGPDCSGQGTWTPFLAPTSTGSSYLRVPSVVSLATTVSAQSTGTLRQPLQIRVEATPQMFQAELEWLYTGQGLGEVIEWLEQSSGPRAAEMSVADRSGTPSTGLLGLGFGVHMPATTATAAQTADPVELKRERLRNDLVYMWRSKLFSDVKLILPLDSSVAGPGGSSVLGPEHSPSDQSFLGDATSTTATFSAHKFILVSRSPYFAQLLLNPGGFRSADPARSEIKLSSPPFTPASVHFCLGYMYAGTLAFSNRKHDLQTAFQIHRTASYLQIASLRSEIEARIVHEMCDSFAVDAARPPTKLTSRRIPRVWRFAAAPDVGAKDLEQRCRDWIVVHWADCWGREVGSVGKRERDSLVKDTLATLRPDGVVAFYRGLLAVKARAEVEIRTVQPRGLRQTAWSDNLLGMALEMEQRTRAVLVRHAEKVFASDDFAGLLEGRGFERDLLEKIMGDLAAGVAGPESCRAAGRVYQCVVASLLLKIDPLTSEPVLPHGSRNRILIEETRLEILRHIRRRWTQIREAGGFKDLELLTLKDIAKSIEQPEAELVAAPIGEIKAPLRRPPVLSSSLNKARLTASPSMRSIASSASLSSSSTNSVRTPTIERSSSRPVPPSPSLERSTLRSPPSIPSPAPARSSPRLAIPARAAVTRPKQPNLTPTPVRAMSSTTRPARPTATVLRKSTSASAMPPARLPAPIAGRPLMSSASASPPRPSHSPKPMKSNDPPSQWTNLATFSMSSGPPMASRPARYNPAAAFDPPRRMPLRPVQSQEAFVVRDVTTLEPAAAESGVSFGVGIPVLFHAMGRSRPSCFGRAFVRYIGRLKGEKGPWVGLEVVEAGLETIFTLHRDGTYCGVKYFELGEEEEHNWHSSRSLLEGERRRKSSGTSGGTSIPTAASEPTTSSPYLGSQHCLAGQSRLTDPSLRPCVFVRPGDVAWVNPN